jgi:hypothetical protein
VHTYPLFATRKGILHERVSKDRKTTRPSSGDAQPRIATGNALDVALSRDFVEGLLNSYLIWAADFVLQERGEHYSKLPPGCAVDMPHQ